MTENELRTLLGELRSSFNAHTIEDWFEHHGTPAATPGNSASRLVFCAVRQENGRVLSDFRLLFVRGSTGPLKIYLCKEIYVTGIAYSYPTKQRIVSTLGVDALPEVQPGLYFQIDSHPQREGRALTAVYHATPDGEKGWELRVYEPHQVPLSVFSSTGESEGPEPTEEFH